MEINLCNYKVLIDEDDYEKVMSYKWYVLRKTNRVIYLASHIDTKNGKRESLLLHRLIMNLEYGNKLVVDHIDCNTLNNVKSNLRICTRKNNSSNCKISSRNKTGYKGVSLNKTGEKYNAFIGVNYKRVYLGVYDTPQEAHKAYCEASKKYHGEYGRTE